MIFLLKPMSYQKQMKKQYQPHRPPLSRVTKKCPGSKIRSGGKGRGIGIGKGKGPVGTVNVATVNTRKWGEVLYPKGSKPIVAEVKVFGDLGPNVRSESSVIKEGLGYRKDSDLDLIRKALEVKVKNDLAKNQKADVMLNFPAGSRKPVKFSVIGEQPLRPRIIYYPPWEPPEGILNDIRKELQNPNRKTASDAEVAAYLSSASLANPPSEQWTRIYMYVTRNYLKSKGWKKFKGGMEFLDDYKTLRSDDERELKRLREWIFEEQRKDLAERQKQEKKIGTVRLGRS